MIITNYFTLITTYKIFLDMFNTMFKMYIRNSVLNVIIIHFCYMLFVTLGKSKNNLKCTMKAWLQFLVLESSFRNWRFVLDHRLPLFVCRCLKKALRVFTYTTAKKQY